MIASRERCLRCNKIKYCDVASPGIAELPPPPGPSCAEAIEDH